MGIGQSATRGTKNCGCKLKCNNFFASRILQNDFLTGSKMAGGGKRRGMVGGSRFSWEEIYLTSSSQVALPESKGGEGRGGKGWEKDEGEGEDGIDDGHREEWRSRGKNGMW